ELLDSVEGPEDMEWTAAWASELNRRVEELDSGAVQGIPWEQVRAGALERLSSSLYRSFVVDRATSAATPC
ncbi:MAG: addiction module protein, partial [Polyangiaceae bacterium]